MGREAEERTTNAGTVAAQPDPRRWRALLVLDVTVVNVALPRIQHDLGFSRPGLAWVVNGYVIMAGGLLPLGLIALHFADARERIKAPGIWGGLSGLAGVSGVVISGVLTELASWRWIFFVNLPVAVFALLIVPRLVSESRMVRERRRLDFTGAITATGGLAAVVYGLRGQGLASGA